MTTGMAAASPIERICVFCGSGPGRNPAYVAAARILGQSMAESGIGLVYGGGSLGLMGETAKAVLAGGGRVTGIIPAFLTDRERTLREAQEVIVTKDMHERKMLMFERSDAFVALPGGIGTLEELVEQLTWSQLGQHKKPIVLVDVNGFWKPFLTLVEHMRDEAFIRAGLDVRFRVVARAEEVVPAIKAMALPVPARPSDAKITERF
ncbi:MAG: TIGR00730 family Rossman fold protein [Hyphomicrobiaceae bacterium]